MTTNISETTDDDIMFAWLSQLFLNACGYATVLVTGWLFIYYVRKSGYLKRPADGVVSRLIHMCVIGQDETTGVHNTSTGSSGSQWPKFFNQFGLILFCSIGLLVSYLAWGLLQERIMAVKYSSTDGKLEHFHNSLFLEFMNRFLAFFVACLLMMILKQPSHTAPVYKYSFNALSNVMSSWCQYEALKYISFPIQVLTKAAKVIPVMLMGRVVSRKSYSAMEYITAGMISFGLFLFVMSSDRSGRDTSNTTSTFAGAILLLGYLVFDSFTSNWQSNLFNVYHMSSIQMMAGSNLFSVLFAGVSLVEQGGFIEALSFMSRHPEFLWHIILLSVTSAVGQLFIYYTIAQFGAATFTIIMTIRQGFAVLLSCIVYQHSVQLQGIFGVLVCFVAIFIRIFHGHSNNHGSHKTPELPISSKVALPNKSGAGVL